MASCFRCGSNSGDKWLCGGDTCYTPASKLRGTVYESRTHGEGIGFFEVFFYMVLGIILVLGFLFLVLRLPLPHLDIPSIVVYTV